MPERGDEKLRRPLSRSKRLLRKHWIVASIAVLLALLVAATAVLFIWPSTDQPRRVDAVVALAGPGEGSRKSEAITLVKKGYVPVLLFSQGNAIYDGRSHPVYPCPDVRRVLVVCFVANPSHTIGEIKWAANFAKRHGSHSLIVVSGRTQVTEGRLLMERCYSGDILMVPAPSGLGENLSSVS